MVTDNWRNRSTMNKDLEKQGCTCERGYKCRFCRVLDFEDFKRTQVTDGCTKENQ